MARYYVARRGRSRAVVRGERRRKNEMISSERMILPVALCNPRAAGGLDRSPAALLRPWQEGEGKKEAPVAKGERGPGV